MDIASRRVRLTASIVTPIRSNSHASFTDLVGTTAVPAHAFDIAELTELTPALDTAQATHGTSVEASEALPAFAFDPISAAERPTEINP